MQEPFKSSREAKSYSGEPGAGIPTPGWEVLARKTPFCSSDDADNTRHDPVSARVQSFKFIRRWAFCIWDADCLDRWNISSKSYGNDLQMLERMPLYPEVSLARETIARIIWFLYLKEMQNCSYTRCDHEHTVNGKFNTRWSTIADGNFVSEHELQTFDFDIAKIKGILNIDLDPHQHRSLSNRQFEFQAP